MSRQKSPDVSPSGDAYELPLPTKLRALALIRRQVKDVQDQLTISMALGLDGLEEAS